MQIAQKVSWVALFPTTHQRKIFQTIAGSCEQFNIKIQTTPVFSPWSNGVCERHNQTLTTVLLKIKDDIKCNFETVLTLAVSIKNYLSSTDRFNPAQLVFIQNPSLPNIIRNILPAKEVITKSFDIASLLTITCC